jgi:hypothetical protein
MRDTLRVCSVTLTSLEVAVRSRDGTGDTLGLLIRQRRVTGYTANPAETASPLGQSITSWAVASMTL